MPTGYTQQIIDGKVKTPKEFLHLCLRNFGVCVGMMEAPFEAQVDYTEFIKKYYQGSIDYHVKVLENAKKEYTRISTLSDDDLYKMYVEKFTDDKDYYQKRADEIKEQNTKYQTFYDAIKNWDCSEEFSNIKEFALNQINISKEDIDSYVDKLSKKALTKEEFISNEKSKYKKDLFEHIKWNIDFHQKELNTAIKGMNDGLAFYERFKKEIEKL